MSSVKSTPEINTAHQISAINKWNIDNEQKNADLAAVKAKATEEYLIQAGPPFDSKSFKYAKTAQKTLSEADKKALALKEKDKGNEYFAKAQYSTAIEHYTEAIKYDATNTACFANRALCYIKTERWIKAIEDCNAVIKLDPNYVKAYLRRGVAFKNSKKLSLALLDFEQVLRVEPANKEAALELKAVKELLALEERSQRTQSTHDSALDVGNKSASTVSHVAKAAPVLEKKSDVFLHQVKQEKKTANEDNKAAVVNEPSPSKRVEPTPVTTATTPAPIKSAESMTAVPKQPIALSALIPTAVPDAAPKHFYEFERSWNSLKDDNIACYKYFKLIKPESYPALFKEAMTSELLVSIWHLLRENSFPDDVEFAVQAMKCLPKLSRFDMLLLFLEKSEKQALEELWNQFAKSNVDPKTLSAIKAMYR